MSSVIRGTAGDDNLTGTSGDDTFNLTQGGNDAVNGGAGDDTFKMGATLNAGDRVDGGSGNDIVILQGDYSAGLTLDAATIQNVETLRLNQGFDYKLTMNDGNVAAGQTLTINAALGAGNHLIFDGSAEQDGHFTIYAGAGNDTITGGAQSDLINLSQGGNDTASGGAGDDTFAMGAALTAADHLDGGAGTDIVSLSGDYSGGLVFGATTIVNIEKIQLAGGNSYSLTMNDANVAAGQTLGINALNLGAGDHLDFDGSAEQDGHFYIYGGAGDDIIIGGAKSDTINLSKGGNDTVHAGDGHDTVNMGAALTAADQIDGGAGDDTVVLDGNYSAGLTLGANTLSNVETIAFDAGHNYNLTTNDANVAVGLTLTVDGSALGATDVLTFNGAAESDGNFDIIGGAGNDVLTGGALADTFDLSHGGNDTAHGGAGNDTFVMGGAFNANDTIDGGAGNDTLLLNGISAAGIVLHANTLTSVEAIVCASGSDYNITTIDANVAPGQVLTVDASALGAGDSIVFNGAAENDGSFAFIGGAADDVLTGGSGNDTFDLTRGGDDVATGGAGNDTFNMGATYTTDDIINGGAGNDTLSLNGDYSAGMTLNSSDFDGIEILQLGGGHSYNFTIENSAVPSQLTVDASALGAGDQLILDATAVTSSSFLSVTDGAGDDIIKGETSHNQITFSHGGDDTFIGGVVVNGVNNIIFDGTFTADDKVDGGSTGTTLVSIEGTTTGNVVLNADTLQNVQYVNLEADGNFSLTTVDATFAAGQTVMVSVGGSGNATFDGSAETDASFSFNDGASGLATIYGGALSDTFTLRSSNDVIHGNGGDDVIILNGSNSPSIDGGAGDDTVQIEGSFATITFSGASDTNIEKLVAAGGNEWSSPIVVTGDITGGGGTLTVDNSALPFRSANPTFDFSGATTTAIDYTGNSQDDTVIFGAANANWSSVDAAGSGNNTFEISGGGSATIDGANVEHFQVFSLVDGYDYTDIAITGDITTGGGTLSVNTYDLSSGHSAVVDLSGATTSGIFVNGGEADETYIFSAANLSQLQSLSAGDGNDTFELTGGTTGVTLSDSQINNVENIAFADGSDYTGVVLSGYFSGTGALTIDASALTGTHHIQVDASNLSTGTITFTGGAGDDAIVIGNNIHQFASIDGGAGHDTLELAGGASNFTLTDGVVSHIETLAFADGASYSNVVLTGDFTTGGGTFSVDASALSGGNAVTGLDLSGVTTTTVDVTGSSGNDSFVFGANLSAGDAINGGDGNDTVTLNGDYSAGVTFGATTLTNVETLVLDGGHSYSLTTDDATVASDQVLTVDASALGTGDKLIFNGAAETDGSFLIIGGAGADVLTGGSQSDTFQFNDVSFSTSTGYDTITNVDFSSDLLKMDGGSYLPNAIDTAIAGGALSAATFDTDLAAAVDAGHLAAGDAVLFTADSGDLAGQTFLIVDHNGQAGYQAGQDYVIDVTGYTGTLTTGSFI